MIVCPESRSPNWKQKSPPSPQFPSPIPTPLWPAFCVYFCWLLLQLWLLLSTLYRYLQIFVEEASENWQTANIPAGANRLSWEPASAGSCYWCATQLIVFCLSALTWLPGRSLRYVIRRTPVIIGVVCLAVNSSDSELEGVQKKNFPIFLFFFLFAFFSYLPVCPCLIRPSFGRYLLPKKLNKLCIDWKMRMMHRH